MFWFPKLDLTSIKVKQEFSTTHLDLDGDAQEEYSTMLLWLQNQVEMGEPSENIVKQCLEYFAEFQSRAAWTLSQNRITSVFAVIHQQSFGSGGLRLPLRPLLRRFLGLIAQGAARTRRATVSR